MPLDSTGNNVNYFIKGFWKVEFAWLPHICAKSKKIIWLTYAYRGRRWVYDNVDRVTKVAWLSKRSYLIESIKGNV